MKQGNDSDYQIADQFVAFVDEDEFKRALLKDIVLQ